MLARSVFSLLFLMLCLALSQCSTHPQRYREAAIKSEDQVIVVYSDSQGVRTSLCNQGFKSPQEAYSRPGSQPGLKVVKDLDMQDLLNEFAAHRFFQKATLSQPNPRASANLSVSINGRTQVFSRLRETPKERGEDVQDFISCMKVFFTLSNLTTSFSSSPQASRDLFKRTAQPSKSGQQ